MCSTYSTSRVGFVSHDHYLRTVVKQRNMLSLELRSKLFTISYGYPLPRHSLLSIPFKRWPSIRIDRHRPQPSLSKTSG